MELLSALPDSNSCEEEERPARGHRHYLLGPGIVCSLTWEAMKLSFNSEVCALAVCCAPFPPRAPSR